VTPALPRRRLAQACAGLLSLALLGACSTAATPDQMTVPAGAAASVSAGAPGYHALRIGEVSGGGKTNPLWFSGASSDDFHSALRASLRNLNYLAADGSSGGYVVNATLVDLDRSALAVDPVLIIVPVDMNVTATIHYTVTPAGGGAPVFDGVVAATGTGEGDSALTSDGRIRKGVEAAMRANIVEFLKRLQTQWR
jgi:hypothetical protein